MKASRQAKAPLHAFVSSKWLFKHVKAVYLVGRYLPGLSTPVSSTAVLSTPILSTGVSSTQFFKSKIII